jgi:hypothetical protein
MAGKENDYQYSESDAYQDDYEMNEEQGVDFDTSSTPQEQVADTVNNIEPVMIGTYTTVQIDTNLNQVQMDVNRVSDKTDIHEGKLADGTGLFTTISTTTEYQTDVDGRAQGAVDGLVIKLQDDDTINQLLPKFAKQSDLIKTAIDMQAKFTSGGGVNLLRNSSAYGLNPDNSLMVWALTSGAATQYLGSDCIEVGSGITINTGVIKQTIQVPALLKADGTPQEYTLTLKVKKDATGSAYVKLSDGVQPFQQMDLIDGQPYDYVTVQIAGFIPQGTDLTVELSGTGTTAIFTAIMLNMGTLGLQWSHANGEVYNGVVKFDINGVKVISSVYDGYTVMSSSEFSGYYRKAGGAYIKVFTLNKEVTEVSKLKVTDSDAEISMGSVKMIAFDNGINKGWAFIPS